jgi:UDP-N-acetylmuramoyl-tripeptide--D-alanyl-D-alanine ligase
VGYDVQEAGDRLASYKNVEKHFEIKEGINGSTVIDDTWSTNPTSTEAALKLLKDFSNGRKTIAVLGKMSLLGKSSSEYHRKIGEKIADMGIDRLIVIGEGAGELGKGALRKGMKEDHVHFCKDSGEAYRVLKDSLDGNTVVLVKTSMLSSFDDLVDKIVIEK